MKRNIISAAITADEVLKEQWSEGDTVLLLLEIRYMKLSGEGKNAAIARINRYIEHMNRRLSRYCSKQLLPRVIEEYKTASALGEAFNELSIRCISKITYNSDYVVSIVSDITETSAQLNRSFRISDVWSLLNGCPLPLSAFFGKGVNYKKQIKNYAAREALRLTERGFGDFFDNTRRNVSKNFSPDNFYITRDGLSVFFPAGTIAPRREGIPVFTLRWNEAEWPLKPTAT